MRQRIAQIGARRKGPKDIGEKGIGNLAPTAIARLYRMITRKRDAKPKTSFFQISLDREAIEGKAEVAFDYKWLESGFSLTSGGEVASTFIDVKDIEPAALRQLAKEANPAQFLADFLAEAFSAKIRETEIRLEIVVISEDGTQTKVMVKPIQFPGRREVIEIPTPRGPVTFEMYLSRTQTKNPKIEVNHQNRSSFPLQGVEMLWHEVAGFFNLGHIQGEIHLNFGVMTPDRNGLMANSDLDVFHDAVIKFVTQYGQPWITRLRAQFKNEHLQDLALRTIKGFERSFAGFQELLQQFRGPNLPPSAKPTTGGTLVKTRTVPPPPLPPKKKKPEDVPTLIRPVTPKPPVTPLPPAPPKPTPTGKKPPTKTPTTPTKAEPEARVDEPEKKVRVEGQGGLVILFHEGDEETGYKWHIRLGENGEERGCLIFNIAHPDFTAAEQKGDMSLRQYMTYYITVMLVKTLLTPEEWRVFHHVSENVMPQFLEALLIKPGT